MASNDRDGIGEHLVTYRKSLGWSQEFLAERSTVSIRTIRNIETGMITSPRRTSIELLVGAVQSAWADKGSDLRGPDPLSGLSSLWPLPARSSQEGPAWLGPRGDTEPIVGRVRDLAHVRQCLQRDRCIVLHGPGGVGKTRLALVAADLLGAAFSGGVAIVEAGVLPAEAKGTTDELARLCRAAIENLRSSACATGSYPDASTRGRLRMLIVVDNAEHVVETTARTAKHLLDEFTSLSLIVTSRHALPMPFASAWEVEPLECERAGIPDAAELFLRQAHASCPTLDLEPCLDKVRTLCTRLEGIPFAIELAAARLRSVPLDVLMKPETVTRLGRARSAGLPHQRSLADSVRWSHELLRAEQRDLLDLLAGLDHTFSIADVEKLVRDEAADDLIGSLSELVDSSMVQVTRGPQYEYRLLGYVRELISDRSAAATTSPLHYPPDSSGDESRRGFPSVSAYPINRAGGEHHDRYLHLRHLFHPRRLRLPQRQLGRLLGQARP